MKTRNHTKELSFNVSVTFEADDQFLESTPIRPIITAEGMIDDQALSDYYGFILELLFELDDARLVVIDEHESSSSETSKHYTLADKKHLNHDST